MLDPYNAAKLAQVVHEERIKEAERLLAQAHYSLPVEPSIRASLAAFVRRIQNSLQTAQPVEEPCPEIPCDTPQPARS